MLVSVAEVSSLVVEIQEVLAVSVWEVPQHQTSLSNEPLKVKEIIDTSEEIVELVHRDSRLLDPLAEKSTNQLAKLNPVVDKGIVKVGGRLDNAPLGSELKYPAILPSDHHVTKPIVRHFHKSNGHAETNQTLAVVHQLSWIIKGPSTVKQIVSGCIQCHRQNQTLVTS